MSAAIAAAKDRLAAAEREGDKAAARKWSDVLTRLTAPPTYDPAVKLAGHDDAMKVRERAYRTAWKDEDGKTRFGRSGSSFRRGIRPRMIDADDATIEAVPLADLLPMVHSGARAAIRRGPGMTTGRTDRSRDAREADAAREREALEAIAPTREDRELLAADVAVDVALTLLALYRAPAPSEVAPGGGLICRLDAEPMVDGRRIIDHAAAIAPGPMADAPTVTHAARIIGRDAARRIVRDLCRDALAGRMTADQERVSAARGADREGNLARGVDIARAAKAAVTLRVPLVGAMTTDERRAAVALLARSMPGGAVYATSRAIGEVLDVSPATVRSAERRAAKSGYAAWRKAMIAEYPMMVAAALAEHRLEPLPPSKPSRTPRRYGLPLYPKPRPIPHRAYGPAPDGTPLTIDGEVITS